MFSLQEEKPTKKVNETTTVHYVRMVLTNCKKDKEGRDTMNDTPEVILNWLNRKKIRYSILEMHGS